MVYVVEMQSLMNVVNVGDKGLKNIMIVMEIV